MSLRRRPRGTQEASLFPAAAAVLAYVRAHPGCWNADVARALEMSKGKMAGIRTTLCGGDLIRIKEALPPSGSLLYELRLWPVEAP